MDKKPWQTPTLVVLVRGQQAEAILATCKTLGGAAGPQSQRNGCNYYDNPTPYLPLGCYECYSLSAS